MRRAFSRRRSVEDRVDFGEGGMCSNHYDKSLLKPAVTLMASLIVTSAVAPRKRPPPGYDRADDRRPSLYALRLAHLPWRAPSSLSTNRPMWPSARRRVWRRGRQWGRPRMRCCPVIVWWWWRCLVWVAPSKTNRVIKEQPLAGERQVRGPAR